MPIDLETIVFNCRMKKKFKIKKNDVVSWVSR